LQPSIYYNVILHYSNTVSAAHSVYDVDVTTSETEQGSRWCSYKHLIFWHHTCS